MGFHIGNVFFSFFAISMIVLALVLLVILFWFVPFRLWISALSSGAKVSIFSLIGMRIRRVPPSKIVLPLIKLTKANIPVPVAQLESHYMAGGNLNAVVNALIAAYRANLELPFDRAAAIDLAGLDVFETVKISTNPRVIEIPTITAVAGNGIEIRTMAKVTVRSHIKRVIGFAGEETILARVGEGIATIIGSATNHREVLERPDKISNAVLAIGLDKGTAYEILSIDLADVSIGRNIDATLQVEQAEADKKIAEAKAEERRALAVAEEQEMRVKLVEAETDVPRALSEALRSGNIGYMDYVNLKNKESDTKMRENIGNMPLDMFSKSVDK